MKSVDVKTSTEINYDKFKIGDFVRILKYKNISAKVYDPNRSKEGLVIKKVIYGICY